MEEWKEYKLGDVCKTISDTYKGEAQYVILINTSDVLEGKCLNHQKTPNKNLKGQFKKTFKRNDILYSEIRPANKRYAYIDFEPSDYIASTKLMVIRHNEKILPLYLFYILKSQEVFINGKVTEVTTWMLGSKSQNAEEDAARKREMAKFVNWYFLDAFKYYIDEQQKNGVISEVRHRTYMTCWGIWERMERYQNKRYKVKNLTTSVLYDFRHFILNEYELWETKKVVKGKYKKTQKIIEMPVPKERYKYIYLGYDVIESRGVEQRSLNTVVVHFKYLKAFWHWLIKMQKAKVDDIFATFTMDQSVYGTPFFFSSEDRQKLFEADFSKRPELAVQRDIFVFQSLVGCRIGDLKRLKKSNVVDGKYLQYVAGKTKNKSGKTVIVPLHPTAKIIIARYAHTPDDRLLPFDSDQRYNTMIKQMFKAVPDIDHVVTILDPVTRLEKQVKLSEVASSHMGRRNFCGNLYDAGFRDADIASMSGHAEGSKAISRYRKVSDEKKQEMIDAL